jgi:hypothetical protein
VEEFIVFELGQVFDELAGFRVPQVEIDISDNPSELNEQRIGLYVRGPLPLSWWGQVCQLQGPKIIPTALAIWFLVGLRNKTAGLELTTATLEHFGVNDRSLKSRALATLEEGRLIQVERRPGKNPVVQVMENDRVMPLPDLVEGKFVRGPIPIRWLGCACRLPGQKVLQVALALWFLAGVRKCRTDLILSTAVLERFGVFDRSTKNRALDLLEGAALIKVESRRGRNPRVSLLRAGKIDHKTQPSPPE